MLSAAAVGALYKLVVVRFLPKGKAAPPAANATEADDDAAADAGDGAAADGDDGAAEAAASPDEPELVEVGEAEL